MPRTAWWTMRWRARRKPFEHVRRFLSYLPSSIDELPPRADPTDAPDRRDESLIKAVPRERRRVYKMRPIIEAVVDQGSFFEIGRYWGKASITGLARLDGWPVAVIASDPYAAAGAWTADSADKLIRFIDLAQTFHLPVVHLVDVPGFAIGVAGGKGGHHPPRGARHVGGLSGHRALVHDHRAQVLRHRRRRRAQRRAGPVPLLLAVGRLGLAAGGRRNRGRLQARPGSRRRPGGSAGGPSRPHGIGPLALPHRRRLPGGGDHRPPRHPPPALRIRQPGATAPEDRAEQPSACGPDAFLAGRRWRSIDAPAPKNDQVEAKVRLPAGNHSQRHSIAGRRVTKA